jgi:hypothetical protein
MQPEEKGRTIGDRACSAAQYSYFLNLFTPAGPTKPELSGRMAMICSEVNLFQFILPASLCLFPPSVRLSARTGVRGQV